MKKILVLMLCFVAFFTNAETIEKSFNVVAYTPIAAVSYEPAAWVVQDTIKNETTIIKKVAEQQKSVVAEASASVIVPSQGFSMTNLWRGLLGMCSLIVIAFLFWYLKEYRKRN